MVSDQEIVNGVESILRHSDPNAVTSVNVVVQQLEANLGLDLSGKTAFISERIELLLGSPTPPSKDHFASQYLPQFPDAHHQSPLPSSPSFPPLPPQNPNPIIPAAAAEPAKSSAPTGTKRRGGPGGLNKLCSVSTELQAIVGSHSLSRTEIVKKLWAYIRKNNLQDPSNKRKIICNDELRLVFETDCTDMFQMNKLLAKHITNLEPTKDSCPDAKKLKNMSAETAPEPRKSEEIPVVLSDVLSKFLETDQKEMLPSDVISHVWKYIKDNQLEVASQDSSNSMVILCDEKLQELFSCSKLLSLRMPEMLAQHFFIRS